MKRLKIILIILLKIFCTLQSHAQDFKPLHPQFSGQVSIEPGAPKIDSFIVHYYRPNGLLVDRSWIIVRPDSVGFFNFRLPYFKSPYKIIIIACRNDGNSVKVNSYGVESGDNIKLNVISKIGGCAVKISGKGANKYVMLEKFSEMENLASKFYVHLQLYLPENLNKKFERLDSLMLSLLSEKKMMLANAGLSLDTQFMLNNEFFNIYSIWDQWLYNMSIRENFKNSKNRDQIRKYFNSRKKEYSYPLDERLNLYPSCIGNLAFRNKFDIMINSDKDLAHVRQYCEKVKAEFPKSMAQYLTAYVFQNRITFGKLYGEQKVIDSLKESISEEITSPSLRGYFAKMVKLNKGRRVFDASFQDINGNSIAISSLKGKVVLIDMWGVGCSGCAMFHDMFKREVYPRLLDKKDFVVLSVSMDSSVEKWKDGLRSGKYTSNDNLNVHTSGKSYDHPFAKYYQITGAPFLLLIDKDGKIVSTMDDVNKPEQVLAKINEAFTVSRDK